MVEKCEGSNLIKPTNQETFCLDRPGKSLSLWIWPCQNRIPFFKEKLKTYALFVFNRIFHFKLITLTTSPEPTRQLRQAKSLWRMLLDSRYFIPSQTRMWKSVITKNESNYTPKIISPFTVNCHIQKSLKWICWVFNVILVVY